MRTARSVAAILALVLAGVGLIGADAQDGAAGPPRESRPASVSPATVTGTIRGQVVRADSGQPLRRVLIDVIGASTGSRVRRALSDADGRYEVRDLPHGTYSIRAARNGFVSMEHGQRHPLQLGRRTVTVGSVTEDADFALFAAGAVSGVVLDEEGEPLTGAIVAVARVRVANHRRTLAAISRSRPTNDLGEFRVSGLPEGDFIVGVAPRLEPREDVEQEYVPTYYPGTNSVAEAQRVRVRFGEEVSGLVLPVTSSRAVTVSGTVTNANRAGPLTVTLGQESFVGSGSMSTQTDQAGEFRFTNVPPGEYIVEAARSSPAADETAIAEVRVTGSDVRIALDLRARPILRGRIRFDSSPSSPLPPASSIALVSESPIGDRLVSSQAARPAQDWTFEVPAVLRSQTTIRTRVPEGWRVTRISSNGKDVAGPIRAEGDVSGLEIVLTNRLSTLSGVVLDALGNMATTATVLMMPDPRVQAIGAQPDVVRTAVVDPAGAFTIRDVLPGPYVAVALDHIEEGFEEDPEWLARLVPVTVPVSVTIQGLRRELRLTRAP